ncbi:MAG: thermonuclease [Bacilli bacterium]|jgi:micrococcal nuclease|nr:thermonuclease [Bacilli bacterium]
MKKNRYLLWFIIIVVFISLIGCTKQSNTIPNRTSVKVERVVDGDTIEVKYEGKSEKVRFIGMDTPETKKPNTPVMFYGKEASAYTKNRLEKQTIELEWDVEHRDKYGRLLAYIWIGKELFNTTLIQAGYARLSTFPPNVKYEKIFTEAQKQARKQGNGIWKDYNAAFEAKK